MAASDYAVIKVTPVAGGTNVKVNGINALGQAVGEVTVSTVRKAFIWLPDSDYGLSAGMTLLDSSLTSFVDSAAYDINDAGIVVGWANHDPGYIGGQRVYPYVWDLSGTFGSIAIDAQDRVAHDINNDAMPLIVGGIEAFQEPHKIADDGFVYDLNTDIITFLNAHVSFRDVTAICITDTSMSGWRIGGLSSCNQFTCPPPGDCFQVYDGQYLDNTTTASELGAIGTCGSPAATARVVGYSVNADWLVVGFGNDPSDTTGGGIARRRAVTWASGAGSAPTPLPRISSTDENEAFDIRGIASSGPMEVVGWSLFNQLAQLWRWNGSSWDRITLDDVSECLSGSVTTLRTARAINTNGWIAGDTNGAGWILVPRCPADLANTSGVMCPDGRVDIFDLFALLSNWDTDGPGAALASPTNIVNVFDLFVLLSSWSGISEPTCPAENVVGPGAASLEDEVTGAGLTMDDWEEFEGVMTDTEEEVKVKENYKCWMMNYLSGCTTCPPCPDDDPYD